MHPFRLKRSALRVALLFVILLGSGLCHAQEKTHDPEIDALIKESSEAWTRNEFDQASTRAKEAHSLAVLRYGAESLQSATTEHQQAFVRLLQPNQTVQEQLENALRIRRKLLPPNSKPIAASLVTYGQYLTSIGRPDAAIPFLLEAERIYNVLGANEPGEYETAASTLAYAYKDANQRRLAIQVWQRYVIHAERAFGPKSLWVRNALEQQASLAKEIGDLQTAESIKKSLESSWPKQEQAPLSIWNVNLFVYPLLLQGNYSEAVSLLRRVLGSDEAKQPFFTQQREGAELLLIEALVGLKQFNEAEQRLDAALRSSDRYTGYNRSKYLQTLLAALNFYAKQGRFAEGDRIVKAIDLAYERSGLTPQQYQAGQVVSYLVDQARIVEALAWSRRIVKPIREWRPLDHSFLGRPQEEQRAARWPLMQYLRTVQAGFPNAFRDRPDLLDEAFQISQLVHASDVAESIARMAQRRVAKGDGFAGEVRKLQDGYATLDADEASLSSLLTIPVEQRAGRDAEAERVRIERAREVLQRMERTLSARYPRSFDLLDSSPLTSLEVTKLLRPNEALLHYTVDTGSTYLSVVRHDNAAFTYSLSGEQQLATLVGELREKLTSGESGVLKPMTAADGIPLFNALFQNVDTQLQGVDHIFIIADGPIQSLPFAVLADSNGANPQWLTTKYAFSYLPSVAALRFLRKLPSIEGFDSPFVGFGDPDLDDSNQAPTLSLSNVISPGRPGSRGLADLAVLRAAPSLPETAKELRAVAASLGASDQSLFLRERATESVVKQAPLGSVRVVSFATHGVMAGELSEGAEPGLVLTPPTEATNVDDGYLSASEVSDLELNAEWVLLSACNTAAPNGKPGAEGFSGLANAFLYAGARALLVSNWRVSSDATTSLMTSTMSRYAKDSTSKASALRGAMLEMMATPRYAHPYFWAPFAVVGD